MRYCPVDGRSVAVSRLFGFFSPSAGYVLQCTSSSTVGFHPVGRRSVGMSRLSFGFFFPSVDYVLQCPSSIWLGVSAAGIRLAQELENPKICIRRLHFWLRLLSTTIPISLRCPAQFILYCSRLVSPERHLLVQRRDGPWYSPSICS